MTALHIDFETRSALDLKKVGLWNYVRHPSTDVWCVAAALGDAEPSVLHMPWFAVTRGSPFLQHVEAGLPVYAHNAAFELAVWNEIMVPRYGWPRLEPEQTHCTMVMAYAMGLPGGLEDAALALGLSVLKDAEGRSLMLRMARPRRTEPDGTLVWWDEPEKLARLYAYCQQDVRVERALHERLMPLSAGERKLWLLDYEINQRGARIDRETAAAGVGAAERIKAEAGEKLSAITGGAVQSPTALAAMKQWLAERNVPTESLNKENVAELLAAELPSDVRRALIVRQEAGKASVAKLDKMLHLVGEDDRLHNMFQFYGAGTGRWAGRGVQPHNFVRDMPPAAEVEEILALLRAGDLDRIDLFYGPPMHKIAECLRSFFVASPGHKLLAGDFSGVEGCGTAWFCGEQWKIDALRASHQGRGPGMYELTASATFGLPIEQCGKGTRYRQVGKVQELAFGYQGGIGAARVFLPADMADTTDAEIDMWKRAWRAKHPRTEQTWYDLTDAALLAVQNPGEKTTAGFPGRHVVYRKVGSFLWCLLPSGRALCYPYPKILPGKYGPQLTYMTVPSDNDRKKGRLIQDPAEVGQYSNTWARVGTFGGSLLENIIQAICRDLLAHCMVELAALGARIVLHVHDEIVVEVREEHAEAARAVMERVMNAVPAWAEGFPLHTKVDVMGRYGK